MANAPKFLLVMRHAEKPADPADPDLSDAGQTRAARLAEYLPTTFGPLDFLFAAAISKHSARPYETLKPLSKNTGLPIDSTIADQDYAFLAGELLTQTRYADKSVVVCWHHGNIPSLMHALGASGGAYPDPWNSQVFNLILQVRFAADGPMIEAITEPF